MADPAADAQQPDRNAAAALSGRRIAILTHSHYSVSKGGAEIAALTLFRGLRTIGIDAILVACCNDAALDQLELGAHELALPHRGSLYDHLYHLGPAEVGNTLIDLLRRERIDILNAHHFLHAGIGVFDDVAAAGISVVFTIHEFLSICHNHGQLVTRGTNLLCAGPSPAACHACYPEHSRQQFAVRADHVARAFASVAAFVSPSRFLADKMTDICVPADRMHVIENGIAHDGPTEAIDRDVDVDGHVWTFGFFGQINPFKGIDVILAACAILARDDRMARSIRVAIHGNVVGQDAGFVARFDAAIADYPFLSYLGAYDNRRVAGLMAACDYVLMPSTWWENSPVVIQEAFHAGRPVICTGIGGMAEKVTRGVNGLHFARNDANDLAERIIEAADPALYRQLQAGIPQTASPVVMAGHYADLFAALPADQSSAMSRSTTATAFIE